MRQVTPGLPRTRPPANNGSDMCTRDIHRIRLNCEEGWKPGAVVLLMADIPIKMIAIQLCQPIHIKH